MSLQPQDNQLALLACSKHSDSWERRELGNASEKTRGDWRFTLRFVVGLHSTEIKEQKFIGITLSAELVKTPESADKTL